MSEDLHNIDDLFRKALEEHIEFYPHPQRYGIILIKALDKKKVVSISKKYNKLKWAAAFFFYFHLAWPCMFYISG